MKAKKWFVLALATVLAVGLLAGCGGSTVNKSSMSVSKVNTALKEAESTVKAKTLEELNKTTEAAAEYMLNRGVLDANTLLGYVASERGYRDNNNRYGAVFVASEEELEAGISASRAAAAIASQISITADTEKIAEIGDLDTPEKVAAAIILGVDEGLKKLSNIPFLNINNITYAVSGRKVTMPSDAVYYLIVVEMSASQ